MKKALPNRSSVKISFSLLFLALCLTAVAPDRASAQERQKMTSPTVIQPEVHSAPEFGRSTMQCAGYFRFPPLKGTPQIVGGENEQEKHIYTSGDFVYLDSGSRDGVREGQEFHIIRPRGDELHVKGQTGETRGSLGIFFQEIGQLRVVKVKDEVSVAQIDFSCEGALLGDLLTGVPDRASPTVKPGAPFDRFDAPSGKPSGRILMAKDGHEMVATGDTIYIDIGGDDQIVPGDTVTIYRKLGTGHLNVKTYDLAQHSQRGFASEQYRGGGLSIQAQRARDRKNSGLYRHSATTTDRIKDERPSMPRKVLGEAVIINVQVRTATAVITNVAQEIHSGDYVEVR